MDKTPSKRPSKATQKAAKATTKDGQKVTRENTADRIEVRQKLINRKGHPK